MKYFLQIILLNFLSISLYCQTNIESHITHIENGLTQEVIAFDTSAINKMNILDRMKYYKVNGKSCSCWTWRDTVCKSLCRIRRQYG